MNIILRDTIQTETPETMALWFQACLAVDKGHESKMYNDGEARIVVADDGQAVRFEPKVRES